MSVGLLVLNAPAAGVVRVPGQETVHRSEPGNLVTGSGTADGVTVAPLLELPLADSVLLGGGLLDLTLELQDFRLDLGELKNERIE